MHGYSGPAGFFPFGFVSGLAGLLFLVGFALFIVWLIRAVAGPSSWRRGVPAPAAATVESPLDILSRRFATGEISAEDFQKARAVLREPPKT